MRTIVIGGHTLGLSTDHKHESTIFYFKIIKNT
jgi:hypothetical protein